MEEKQFDHYFALQLIQSQQVFFLSQHLQKTTQTMGYMLLSLWVNRGQR